MKNIHKTLLKKTDSVFSCLKSPSNIVIFTGSHGVRKTTTLEVLRRNTYKTKYIKLHSEIARQLRREGHEIAGGIDWIATKMYVERHLIRLVEKPKCAIVLDRGLFDLDIYTRDGDATRLSDEDLKLIRVLSSMERSAGLVYAVFPIQFEIVHDGVRSMDKNFQKLIGDRVFSKLVGSDASHMVLEGDAIDRARAFAPQCNAQEMDTPEAECMCRRTAECSRKVIANRTCATKSPAQNDVVWIIA